MRTRGLQGGGAPEVGAPGEGPQDRESCGNFAFGVWDVNKRGKYLTRRHSQRCLLRVLRVCVCVCVCGGCHNTHTHTHSEISFGARKLFSCEELAAPLSLICRSS